MPVEITGGFDDEKKYKKLENFVNLFADDVLFEFEGSGGHSDDCAYTKEEVLKKIKTDEDGKVAKVEKGDAGFVQHFVEGGGGYALHNPQLSITITTDNYVG